MENPFKFTYLFPLFPQVLYALHELIVVILKRGSLLSHTRFGPAECETNDNTGEGRTSETKTKLRRENLTEYLSTTAVEHDSVGEFCKAPA